MALKLFRAVWFLSVLLLLVNLLYVYASLPESVILQKGTRESISKEWLFYVFLISVVGINLLVYLFKALYEQAETLRAWFHGLIIAINIFLIISMHAVNVFNSSEWFDHNRINFVLAGSLALILLWAISWPLYLVFQRFIIKQAV